MNAHQTKVTAKELQKAAAYFSGKLEGTQLNFRLTIGGKPLGQLSPSIETLVLSNEQERKVIQRNIRVDELLVTQEATLYRELPFVEWAVYVRNNGQTDSERVCFSALSDTFAVADAIIHHQNGSDCRPDDFQGYATRLSCTGETFSTKPFGGTSSCRKWPYFTVDTGDSGMNLAIGWPAQWKIEFYRFNNDLRIDCGQESMDSVLHPGELFRSPRMLIQFWDKDDLSAQDAIIRSRNIFRKYMVAYNMPRGEDGKPPYKIFTACSSHQNNEMINATAADQIARVKAYSDKQIPLDYWWMDAGWFDCPNGIWFRTGDWDHDPKRFPKGLREISDVAHERGMGILVWHEPERVNKDSNFYAQHHDFVLDYPETGIPQGYLLTGDPSLYNFGRPEACDWIIEKINSNIDSYGIDLYRQDYNASPLPCWQKADADDRIGSSENLYVMGLLRYWDSIRERHPGMILDTCCAGGRRNDIDTLRRCVPLIRSDCLFVPEQQQAHIVGFGSWIPLHGTGILIGKTAIDDSGKVSNQVDPYGIRSCLSPGINCCCDILDDTLDWSHLRTLLMQWLSVADCYHGEFYPHESFDLGKDKWYGWQLHDAEKGKGFLQVFRRPANAEETCVWKLHGLEETGAYAITDVDGGEGEVKTGAELMSCGLTLCLPPRTAKIYKYVKI